jgi:alkyl hydroperoxide reductase subunit F
MTCYDLIIIGGGPAGITAGIYAVRQKLNTLLIAKNFGGQMARKAVAIENYPGFEEVSGLELSRKFEKHLRKQKIAVERDSATKIKKIGNNFYVVTGSKHKFSAKAVIVASGADPRPLEVPGEKEFIGRGVSYCTTCDAPMFAGKKVAVVGGGNAGFEAAIALSNWAKKIYILEYSSKVAADEVNQELVKKTKKVKILTEAALKKIEGDKFVNSIIYQDRKTGKEINLPLEGVFVEIGNVPATGFVKDLVEFNKKDEIKIDPRTNMTKTAGLFVAGDVTDVRWKQIVVAAGEGCKAALSAYGYLRNSRQPVKQYE